MGGGVGSLVSFNTPSRNSAFIPQPRLIIVEQYIDLA